MRGSGAWVKHLSSAVDVYVSLLLITFELELKEQSLSSEVGRQNLFFVLA